MAFSPTLAVRLEEALRTHPRAADVPLRSIKMMGALVFMVRGHMCCGVTGDNLMVRVGAEQAQVLLTEPNVVPLDIGGNRAPGGFVCVEPDALASDIDLSRWVAKSVAFVDTLPEREPF